MTPHETRSGAAWLASATPQEVEAFLGGLSENTLGSLPWLFEFWALPHQLPPTGDWKSWVIMGGRGAGKTRAGSEWVRRMVEGPTARTAGQCHRVALVGETFDQVREVMVFGESGILACSPPDRRPVWEAGRRRLVWANGATATVYSAHEPEALRGPQFDAAWVDELAKWKKSEEVWDMLQFALRLGSHPQQVVTTTPRNVGVLKRILGNASTVVTHAPTDANRAYLAESFLAEVQSRYGGTRLGRQELDGVLLDNVEGALWTTAMVEGARVEQVPKLDRIVVAVDPSVTNGKSSDECGIIVAGVVAQGEPHDWRAYVLEDASVRGGPSDWAKAAIAAMDRHGAERLVAEVNQGGDMVESVIRQIDPLVPFKGLRASRGKGLRAEPVAALYEQGRISHLRQGDLGSLEDQMCQMTVRGFEGRGSPDRLDAMVWAMHELMIEPAASWRRPQMRRL
ncbi:DNA-packaging protein [Paracoccus sp. JM45]|uniref:DNA-packaging protein n=1 Tax=Paracoccus sp. JM45 TaxID=2283626 RepID=UPI002102DA09|nr:terminase family protein [Paracoccus sp. JM45]